MNNNELVEICATFIAETDKAVLINDGSDENENTWVPKSQCEGLPEEMEEGGSYIFTMSEWIATEKGLI